MARYNPLKPEQVVPKPKPDKSTIPSPGVVSHIPTLGENNSKDGLEIRFPTKPDAATLAAFHATQQLGRDHQWHWHRKQRLWYARRNEVNRAFAALIVSGKPAAIPADEQAANLVAASPVKLADAVQNTEALNALVTSNVVAVDFAAAPAASVTVPGWRARFLSRKGTV